MSAGDAGGEDLYRHLVQEIQAGREVERNFKRLHDLAYGPVRRIFSRRGFSREDCDELTQETFLRVFRGIGSFRWESSFITWVYEIAANIYKNELRRRAADKREGHETSLEQLLDAHRQVDPKTLAALASKLASAEDETLRQAQVDALREALASLPPQMRQCFRLRFEQNLKYREIAAVMRISIETVKAHLHQAKVRLREMLHDQAALAAIEVEGTDDV